MFEFWLSKYSVSVLDIGEELKLNHFYPNLFWEKLVLKRL